MSEVEALGERDAAAGPSDGSRCDPRGGAAAVVATPSAIRKGADPSRSPSALNAEADFAEDMLLDSLEQKRLRAIEQRIAAARAT